MKITGKYSIAFFLKIGIDFILLVNIAVLLTLPLILNFLSDPSLFSNLMGWSLSNEIPPESYIFMLCFLYFSCVATAMILFLLRKVLKNLEKDIILDHSNAKMFKLLSLACSVLSVALIIKIIYYNTFMTIFCMFIFIVLSLFSLVLSEVFRQGAIIKEENELTI